MGTAFRHPLGILPLLCDSASVAEGAALVPSTTNIDRCQLPAGADTSTPILGLAYQAGNASTGLMIEVVIAGVWAGIANVAITKGQEVTVASAVGDLKPVSGATAPGAMVLGVALETVNPGERVAIFIYRRAGAAAGIQDQRGAFHTVRGIAPGNVSLTAFAYVAGGSSNPDGVTFAAGDRVLLIAQTTASQNGIYVVGTVAAGAAPLTRAPDFATGATLPAETMVAVSEGTLGGHTLWRLLSQGSALVIDTSALNFAIALPAALGTFGARLVATSSQTLGSVTSGSTIDGVTLAYLDRVLLVGQATATQNGLYILVPGGGLVLAPEWAQGQVRAGCVVQVSEGTVWANSEWKATAAQAVSGGFYTLGTTNPAFYPRRYVASHALSGGAFSDTAAWVLSTTLSNVSAIDTTTAAAVKAVLSGAGPGTGTVALTGTSTDVIAYAVTNW